MDKNKQTSIWRSLLLTGALSAVLYTLHVVLGGALWEGYSHLRQPISDLTANGAPDAQLLRNFTFLYGVLGVVFAFSLFMVIKDRFGKIVKIGVILLLAMEFSSFGGYTLFPLDALGKPDSIQNIMHIIVTAVVVITTIVSTVLIGIGLRKTAGTEKLGIFVLICSAAILLSGIATAVVAAQGIPFTGLIERVNIFTLQTLVLALSLWFFWAVEDLNL